MPSVFFEGRVGADEMSLIQHFVIARSEATEQSSTVAPHWIASLRSQ